MRPSDLGTPFDDASWAPAVCPPYGVGRRGPPVEVQLRDGLHTCIPFRVRIGGARVHLPESGPSRVRLFDHDQDYLLRVDGVAASALREPVTREEAGALVDMLLDSQEASVIRLMEEIVALGERAGLAALCLPTRGAWRQGRTRPAPGQPRPRSSETHLLVRLTLVIAAELALVLEEPLPALHERLFPRG